MRVFRTVAMFAAMLVPPVISAQTIDGDVVGAIFDSTKAAVPNASVALENVATGVKSTVTTGSDGTYRFNNVLIGNYTLAVSAPSFGGTVIRDIQVELNKTTTVNATLQPATVKTDVTVVDAPVLLNTTTAQIGTTYSDQVIENLAISSNAANGALNLALLSGGVASSGGVGAGAGPAVGGQRPRTNNITVEGVDDNRKDIVTPTTLVPNDAVAEITVLQNLYSAEFGHSGGGQMNLVLKSGGNDLHGSLFEYLLNRNLNAEDQALARQGIRTKQRFDSNRFGGQLGGPIRRNSLFYYGLFEYNPAGFASTVSQAISAPTAAGYQTLATLPGISQTNLGILQKYLPAAAVANSSFTVAGAAIPTGIIPVVAPSYSNFYNYMGSIDDTISPADQLRGRFIATRLSQIDTVAALPAFWTPKLITSELVSLSEFHTFRPTLLNELRLAYNRFNQNTPTPNVQYPGLDQFPNLAFSTPFASIGPDINAPQANIQNTYQLIDNLSWNKGRHDLKFGIDARDQIAANTAISAIRGDYEYSTMARFLLDQNPDKVEKRSVGSRPYSGNSTSYYAFVNDNWRVLSNLSLNLGVRYEYNGVSLSMKDYALESAASLPGVLDFFAPTAQKLNFAPRFGFAYSPGRKATTSIRGGFGIGYDPIFDNAALNVRPPEDSSTFTAITPASNFLANGGILPTQLPADPTIALLRKNTTGWLPNQKLGYAMNWSLGVQHEFAHDYTLEVRYLGSRGVHLLAQTQLNSNAVVTPSLYLPTYLQAPSQATLDSLPVTLTQLSALKTAQSNLLAPYGFTQAITAYVPTGNSIYNGLATELKKRFSRHLLFQAAYTWSHLRDDSTAEVNTTSLSPRRPQDFGNLRAEWADSALDRRHRATAMWIYETPWFDKAQSHFLRNVLGGYQVSGTYIVESPEYVTPQALIDANLNTDNAADRAIVNQNGVPGTGSNVSVLKNSAGATVAYLATNPNAQYIVAQQGALSNAGRNTLKTPRINDWDLTAMKNFSFGERFKLQFRADFLNAFNHPQYTMGSVNDISPLSRSGTLNYLNPNNALFGQWNQVVGSTPRNIQLGVKLKF